MKAYHQKLINETVGDANGEMTKEDQDKLKNHEKNVNKIIRDLKTSGFKTNVMREAAELFYDENFAKNLDSNPYLVGFKNGVYDLERNILRRGCPDDNISLRMDINYVEMNEEHIQVKQVEDFLFKIFPDRSVREYFMNSYSDIFVGGNSKKIVLFWSGEGDNGKSVTEALVEKMLGEYAVKLPTSLITGKRTAASSACPELVRAGNGVRFAVLQEPDKRDVLNIGILKELSGNDTFFARGLYKEGSEITPMFELVCICNDPPRVPYSDKATWNRIRVLPFESTFSDNAPSDPAEQLRQKVFPKDKSFADKLHGMTEALAWLLLNHRKKMGGRKSFPEPDKIKHATDHYKNKNDVYTQFCSEHIIDVEGATVSLTQIYAAFKDWYKDSMGNNGIPNKQEARECFTKMWGDPIAKGCKWPGNKIYFGDDDDDEGTASGSMI